MKILDLYKKYFDLVFIQKRLTNFVYRVKIENLKNIPVYSRESTTKLDRYR